jgi:hypothetical protein
MRATDLFEKLEVDRDMVRSGVSIFSVLVPVEGSRSGESGRRSSGPDLMIAFGGITHHLKMVRC